jgi:hypothetical protein
MVARKMTDVVFPPYSDVKFLKSLHKKATQEREKKAREDHQAFLRDSRMKERAMAPLVKQLGLSRDDMERTFDEERKQQQALAKAKPPPPPVITGHNPVRFAPFDMPWSYASWGGISVAFLRGPNAASGEIGADMGIFNGGGASTVASVGFWYYGQQEGTLYITTQALVWGRAYIFAGLFGYASAYAGLRVYVERYSADFTTFSGTTDIYNNAGFFTLDIRSFDWVTRTASVVIPVRANTWYAIWTDAVQSAYAGGLADSVSNFDMYVGPVSYFVV